MKRHILIAIAGITLSLAPSTALAKGPPKHTATHHTTVTHHTTKSHTVKCVTVRKTHKVVCK